MLERPDLPDERLMGGLQAAYGLRLSQLTFLPLGADVNSAVYRAVAADGRPYFLKLRRGPFDALRTRKRISPHFGQLAMKSG